MKKNNNIITIFKIVLLILYIGWAVFLIIEAAMDGAASSNQSGTVTEIVVDTVNSIAGKEVMQNNEKTQLITRKLVGHFLSFTLLGVFSSLTYFLFMKKRLWLPMIINFAAAFAFAALTEFIQSFKAGRSGNFVDICIDFGGFLVSGITISIIFIIKHYKKSPIKE